VVELQIPHQRFALPNGLEVILAPNARLPRVTVNMRYKVGSSSDKPDRAGAAHLFEHLYTFADLAVAKVRLNDVGATQIGATTEFDRTTYYTTIPSSALETALAIEAERMGTIGNLINQSLLIRETKAVRNERRLVVENRPYSLADEAVFENVFPEGHPYHHIYIGKHRDVQAITLDDARNFFAEYYTPNNAVLTIAGDFNAAKAIRLIEKYFGSVPRGNAVDVPVAPSVGVTEVHKAVADQIDRQRLSIAWRAPANYAPGSAEADLLSVVLGHGDESRLYRRLVVKEKLAKGVSAYNYPFRLGSAFVVNVIPEQGADLATIEAAVQDELHLLFTHPPRREEIDRARNTTMLRILRGLERNGDITDRSGLTIDPTFGGISEQLSECAHLTGSPDCVPARISAYGRATSASMSMVAQMLFNSGRITIVAEPGERVLDDPPAPAETTTEASDVDNAVLAAAQSEQPQGEMRAVSAVLPVPNVVKLANGLTIYHVRQPNAPMVTAMLVAKGGTTASSLLGLAAFSVDLLTQGTGSRTAAQITREGAQLGTALETDIDRDAAALRLSVQLANLPVALDLLADVVRNPVFAPDAIERVRALRRERIRQIKAVADTSASLVLTRALYGSDTALGSGGIFNDVLFARPHPYGYEDIGGVESLANISRADLVRFHSEYFTPRNSALIVSGDIGDAELLRLADRYFGDWRGGCTQPSPQMSGTKPTESLVLEETGPSSQTIIRMGTSITGHSKSDAMALRLANIIFGEVYASRITTNLREKNGFTYMARSRVAVAANEGIFAFGTSVKAEATATAIREITHELDRMGRDLVDPSEIRFAKTYLDNSLLDQFENSTSIVTSLSDLFVFNLPPDTFPKISERAAQISPEDIRKAARLYLSPSRMTLVAIGSRDALVRAKALRSE